MDILYNCLGPHKQGKQKENETGSWKTLIHPYSHTKLLTMVKWNISSLQSCRLHALKLTHCFHPINSNRKFLSLYHDLLSHYLIVVTDEHTQGWQHELQHGLSKSFFHFKTQSFQESCGTLRTIGSSMLKSNKTP